MGTNYYLNETMEETCEHCNHTKEPIIRHIGKSSGGWCFSLHVYPDENINTLDDWKDYIKQKMQYKFCKIKDEYGTEITFDELIDDITNRSWERKSTYPNQFYKTEAEFYMKNSASKGPNGLCRHRINKSHCVGHGEGTWDYIIGDFS